MTYKNHDCEECRKKSKENRKEDGGRKTKD